jgi:hypothetical protein
MAAATQRVAYRYEASIVLRRKHPGELPRSVRACEPPGGSRPTTLAQTERHSRAIHARPRPPRIACSGSGWAWALPQRSRRVGCRTLLFGAAYELKRTRTERDRAPVGDVAAAVAVLVEHYEDSGDQVLKLLAEEESVASLSEIVGYGRGLHRDWCARVFAPALAGLRGVERRRRLAQLVAVCDVYMWKLLRRDARLSRRQLELALIELLRPIAVAS